jgi:hypothetical protein
LNLGLALIISVPFFNFYTHGTHVIVAHAMGSTIGINTMILLASIFYVIGNFKHVELTDKQKKAVSHGLKLANVSLAVFLIALIIAGVGKGVFYTGEPYQVIMYNIRPFLMTFTLAGVTLMIGIWAILWFAFKSLSQEIAKNHESQEINEAVNIKS